MNFRVFFARSLCRKYLQAKDTWYDSHLDEHIFQMGRFKHDHEQSHATHAMKITMKNHDLVFGIGFGHHVSSTKKVLDSTWWPRVMIAIILGGFMLFRGLISTNLHRFFLVIDPT